MSWKESKFYSIVNMKCPRCHEGDLFPPNTLYQPTKFSDMHSDCSNCGQPYEPELGYYYGAMFVSYGISTAIFIAVWVAMAFMFDEITIGMMVIALTIAVVILLPLNFRLSRAMWINMFVGYEGPSKQITRKKPYAKSPAV